MATEVIQKEQLIKKVLEILKNKGLKIKSIEDIGDSKFKIVAMCDRFIDKIKRLVTKTKKVICIEVVKNGKDIWIEVEEIVKSKKRCILKPSCFIINNISDLGEIGSQSMQSQNSKILKIL